MSRGKQKQNRTFFLAFRSLILNFLKLASDQPQTFNEGRIFLYYGQ